jgi:hypothetical protein
MSTAFYILAIFSALAMFILGLIGCAMMQSGEELRTGRERNFRLFDIMFLSGIFWTIKSFRANWKVRHQARYFIFWSLGCFAAFVLFITVHIWLEVAKV